MSYHLEEKAVNTPKRKALLPEMERAQHAEVDNQPGKQMNLQPGICLARRQIFLGWLQPSSASDEEPTDRRGKNYPKHMTDNSSAHPAEIAATLKIAIVISVDVILLFLLSIIFLNLIPFVNLFCDCFFI